MSAKVFLVLLLLMVNGLKVKSQALLNVDLSKITKEVELQGGGLKESVIEKNKEMNGYCKRIIFQYPSPPEGNNCPIKSTFCLTLQNKCFKYDEDYWGKYLADKKIAELTKYYSGLKRVKNELKWIDKGRGLQVELIQKKIGHNKFASVYVLEVKNISQ